MGHYAPIFEEIVDSSIWCEPDLVVKVFLTMLAKKRRDGVVYGTAFNIAQWAKKTEAEVIEALKVLASPDKKRLEPQAFDGRRIEKVEGGWLMLNAEKYQRRMMELNKRQNHAAAQAKYQAGFKPAEVVSSTGYKVVKPTIEEIKLAAAKIGLSDHQAEQFFNYYESNGWRVGKNPMKSVNGAIAGWKLRNQTETGAPADDFWKDSKRLELVEKGIKEIEARASHTAMDMIVEPRDAERYGQLKSERKQLKEKMKL